MLAKDPSESNESRNSNDEPGTAPRANTLHSNIQSYWLIIHEMLWNAKPESNTKDSQRSKDPQHKGKNINSRFPQIMVPGHRNS